MSRRSDYYGAKACGLSALLVRRAGPDGESEMKEPDEDLSDVQVVQSLTDVAEWVKRENSA